MKGLTLTQPWATLVAIGAKRIETRSWSTHYRGPIAIHAAKKMPREARHLFHCAPFAQTFADARDRGELPDGVFECDYETGWQGFAERLPRGAIVATASLSACVSTTALHALEDDPVDGDHGLTGFLAEQGAEHELAFGNYATGRWGFVLHDIRVLPEPIPCRGALGLWNLPDEIAAQLDTKAAA